MTARVLFVSKAMAPPFHDGTKCLIRDIASHLERTQPVVMGVRGQADVAETLWRPDATSPFSIEMLPVYGEAGSFSPGLAQNLRAFAWLLSRTTAELWHFVFAPNMRSSSAGRWLRRLKRVPIVQTVASPPRSFAEPERLLFGDVVVAQSRWTRERLTDAFAAASVPPPRIEVIPPPVPNVPVRSVEVQNAVRRELGIAPDAPVFVYPGDLETSSGAESVARAVAPLVAALPDAVIVFAYRSKTSEAPAIADALGRRLGPAHVRFTCDLPDVLALVSLAKCVLFPVDDLWGKVDLPIVLLEAMVLGVPVVVLDKGPLCDLESVVRVADGDHAALVRAALRLASDDGYAQAIVSAQRAEVEARYKAQRVAKAYEQLYVELARKRNAA